MMSPETCVQIRHYFYAEHWKIGTIARELGVHPDAVRHAIGSVDFNRASRVRPSMVDPYMEFVRQTLDRHPRLRATRIYQMLRERGYSGSVVQLRRTVARLRPPVREAFLRLHTFPADQAQVDWAHTSARSPSAAPAGNSPASSSRSPIREPSTWSSSSIRRWRTSCAAMFMRFKLGPANPV